MILKNKFTYTMIALALSFFLLISGLCGSSSVAFAAPSGGADYESQTVIEDLEGATIDGKLFDIKDYGADKLRNTQLLNFVEFGYKVGNTTNYALYFYLYNPQQLDFELTSAQNQIQFRAGNSGRYYKYEIELLDTSGLISKYKIPLTQTDRYRILTNLNSESRVYEVSGVEILTRGSTNATEYEISNTFTYTGEGETLKCTSEGLVTLSLDVHETNYRPSGTNGNSNYTQDTLHSVYFSVPNTYLDEYGDMSEIHAQWINAKTVPMLVIGDNQYYNEFYQNAINNKGASSGIQYLVWSNLRTVRHLNVTGQLISSVDYYGDLVYNSDNYSDDWACRAYYYVNETIDNLPVVLYAENNDAANYTVKSDTLLNYYKNYPDNNKWVANKYSSTLFEEYDFDFTDVRISADEEYQLTSQNVNKYWWEWLFGLEASNVTSNDQFITKAIMPVKSTDFKSTVAETCDNLYIGQSEYTDFKNFYDNATSNNETVYLFRYMQSEYKSQKASIMDRTSSYFMGFEVEYGFYVLDVLCDNAYMAQQSVQLDFDIIDITFTKGDVDTIIAVISSPIDNFAPLTPPVINDGYVNSDGFWRFGFIIVAVLIVSLISSHVIKKNMDKDSTSGGNIFSPSSGGPPVINNYYDTINKRRK